jgi:Zn-dependent protease
VRLFTLHRVPLYVSPITLLFVAVLAGSFAPVVEHRLGSDSNVRTYGLAVVAAVLTIIFIALHELGHALVAQRLRFDVDAITIYGFVGVTEFRPEPQTPGRGFLVSVSGPMVNVVAGLAAWFAYGHVDPNTAAGFVVWSIAYANIVLAIFNLLPGLPLDGGQALASGVWKATGDRHQATRAAAYVGFVVAGALAIFAVTRNSDTGYALWGLVFAAMLGVGAASALRRSQVVERLPGLTAGGIARKAVTVDANLPLSEALRRAEAAGVAAVIVADSSGRPWAVMNGAAVDAVPLNRRPWTTINEVSRPIEEGMRIPESLSGEELMQRLSAFSASEYVVYAPDGQLTGVLVAVDFVARIDPSAAARLARR